MVGEAYGGGRDVTPTWFSEPRDVSNIENEEGKEGRRSKFLLLMARYRYREREREREMRRRSRNRVKLLPFTFICRK